MNCFEAEHRGQLKLLLKCHPVSSLYVVVIIVVIIVDITVIVVIVVIIQAVNVIVIIHVVVAQKLVSLPHQTRS